MTGDDLGWTSIAAGDLLIERYLTEADDLRGELNTWAAWVESRWIPRCPGPDAAPDRGTHNF